MGDGDAAARRVAADVCDAGLLGAASPLRYVRVASAVCREVEKPRRTLGCDEKEVFLVDLDTENGLERNLLRLRRSDGVLSARGRVDET